MVIGTGIITGSIYFWVIVIYALIWLGTAASNSVYVPCLDVHGSLAALGSAGGDEE